LVLYKFNSGSDGILAGLGRKEDPGHMSPSEHMKVFSAFIWLIISLSIADQRGGRRDYVLRTEAEKLRAAVSGVMERGFMLIPTLFPLP